MRCPPNPALFWAKNSHFSPKTALVRVQNSQTKANGCSPHVRLDLLATKGLLLPSNSTICPRNSPKRRQKALEAAQCAPAPQNQEQAVSWATWLKSDFRGHLVHPQPPTFGGFQASEWPNETRRPPYQWSLGAAGGPASPRTVGATGGSTRVPKAKKNHFFQSSSWTTGDAQTTLFGPFLSPSWRVLGHGKFPNALKMGRFGTNNGSKMGQKRVFRKMILDHL